jgi:hypothetical protein
MNGYCHKKRFITTANSVDTKYNFFTALGKNFGLALNYFEDIFLSEFNRSRTKLLAG